MDNPLQEKRIAITVLSVFLVLVTAASVVHTAGVSDDGQVAPVSITIETKASPFQQHTWPWDPSKSCKLGQYRYEGLHPIAESKLEELKVTHRITQALNRSSARGNYHGSDAEVEGSEVTSAIDISVRCLSDDEIKVLLGELAARNIVGWLRRDGVDGWKGPDHIHAIWVGAPLKPRLEAQIQAWLINRNGLRSNNPYQFWAPATADVLRIRALAQPSTDSRTDTDKKRVLAILGDGWHRVAPLDRHLVGKLRDNGWEAVVIMDYDVPWDDFDSYDLIILSREGHEFVQYYRHRDTNPDHERGYWLTKEQSLKFVDYVNAGGRMLLYHDGFGNYPCDYGPARVARSCFIRHPPIVAITVTPTGKRPDLTEGVPSFVVSDEEYEVEMDESQTSVFLESHSPQHGRAPQGWAHDFGEGKVVVLVPGHKMDTIAHPMINRLVQNALDWLTE